MSFIYTGFGPIIEYQFRLSEGSNCVRSSQTWCWSDCRKKPIRSYTSAFTRRFATPFWMVLCRPIAACRRRGSGGGAENVSQHNFNSLRTIAGRGYVVSRRGSGTFVAKTLPDMFLPASSASESSPAPATSAPISRRGQHLLGQVSASPRQWGHLSPVYRTSTRFPIHCSVKSRRVSAAVQNRNSSATAVTAERPSYSTHWWTI